jgi:hypothetical protein
MTDFDTRLDQYAAEDAKVRAEYAAEGLYKKLIADLVVIEDRVNAERRAAGNFDFFYLTDENCDLENIDQDLVENSVEYWDALRFAAACAAGNRGEEERFDVNAALGYVIY